MNKDFDLIVKLYKGEIQDLNLHSAYREEINLLENLLEDEYAKGYEKGGYDNASKIICELRNLKNVGCLRMTLDGLAYEYGVENGTKQRRT